MPKERTAEADLKNQRDLIRSVLRSKYAPDEDAFRENPNIALDKFEEQFRAANNFEEKIELAEYFIGAYDPKDAKEYPDPTELVLGLEPKGKRRTPRTLEETQKRERERKRIDDLYIKLVERGIINTSSGRVMELAEEAMIRKIFRNKDLEGLIDCVPPYIMGAIAEAYYCESLNDEEKRAMMRSFMTRSLLRRHMGKLETQAPLKDVTLVSLVKAIPEKVFKDSADSVTRQLLRSYIAEEALKAFVISSEELENIRLSIKQSIDRGEPDLGEVFKPGFKALNLAIKDERTPKKRELLEEVREEFLDIATNIKIPDEFRLEIEQSKDKYSLFPLFRQLYLAKIASSERALILNAGTGSGKTSTSMLAMSMMGCKRVTVFGPARARDTWELQAKKHFKEEANIDVFLVKGQGDLKDPRMLTAQFVYISSDLLSRVDKNPELRELIDRVVINGRGTDGIIADEVHVFKNAEANWTKTVVDIVTKIRENYKVKFGESLRMPFLALTATPISGGLEDLDIPLALTRPDKFLMPKEISGLDEEGGRVVFSKQALLNPKLAFSLLFGDSDRLMVQWLIKDLFKDGVKELEEIYKRVILPMSAYERVVYEWVHSLPVDSFTKLNQLSGALLNPDLIKSFVERKGLYKSKLLEEAGGDNARFIALLRRELIRLHEYWMDWCLYKDREIENLDFGAEWIAKIGEGEFLLECLFAKCLPFGIDSLVEGLPDSLEGLKLAGLKRDWKCDDVPSAKYKYIRDRLKDMLSVGENGAKLNGQIFIISPSRREGITRDLDDPRTSEAEMEVDALSLYEYIRHEWGEGLSRDLAVKIDGLTPFAKRVLLSEGWRQDGKRVNLVVATMESVFESMDWAPRDTEDNQNIGQVLVIFLSWPSDYGKFLQAGGRFPRLGLGKNKELSVVVLETDQSIDQGKFDVVNRRRLLTQMALSGIPLTAEEQEFYDSTQAARRTLLAEPNVGQYFLRDLFGQIKGRGEDEIVRILNLAANGQTNLENFANYYFDNAMDEFRLVGNFAELSTRVLLKDNPKNIGIIGAGTCLAARKLKRAEYKGGILNVDINGVVLELAKRRFPNIGEILCCRASDLSFDEDRKIPDGTFDALEYGMMLHWTKLYERRGGLRDEVEEIERVKVLLEMNRVLEIGGKVVLTLPKRVMDAENLKRFATTLKDHFGFEFEEPIGFAYGINTTAGENEQRTKELGWILTLKKVSVPKLEGLNADDLAFLSDDRTRISDPKEKGAQPPTTRIEHAVFSPKRFIVRSPFDQSEVQEDIDGISITFSEVGKVISNPARGSISFAGESTIPAEKLTGQVQVITEESLREVIAEAKQFGESSLRAKIWESGIGYIMREEGVSEEEANRKLAKFILDRFILDGEALTPATWEKHTGRRLTLALSAELSAYYAEAKNRSILV